MDRLANFVDSVVALVSPGAALRRKQARAALAAQGTPAREIDAWRTAARPPAPRGGWLAKKRREDK